MERMRNRNMNMIMIKGGEEEAFKLIIGFKTAILYFVWEMKMLCSEC